MIKSLAVWWDMRQVGTLRIDENGDLAFAYDVAWLADPDAPPISFSLPKLEAAFNRRQARPFFAGLLPEEGQRDAVARALGVSKTNDFRLLEQLGGDVAGALTLWPAGDPPPAPRGLTVAEPLSDSRLLEILDTLPTRPFLAGDEGIRLSLAGAQQKLPVVMINGAIALPAPGQPSTHILKPPIAGLASTTENEALALRLAAAVGLSVAAVEPRRTGERAYLLVDRYDRETDAAGTVRRLHQEDFCQALGVASENKYASEGGPTFPPCFELVRRACASPAPSVLRLVDAAIFNVAIGNADAHGKNFSLLYGRDGATLAPLYDLMCTAAYPQVHAKLAMKIGMRSTLDDFMPTTWEDFAREIGVGPAFVRRRAPDLAQAILDAIESVAHSIHTAGFDGPELPRFVEVIRARAQRILDLGVERAAG